MRISARNQLEGTVTRVHRGASIANVELDVGGRRLVASITVEAADERAGEASGDGVVKASDVMLAVDD